MKSISTLSLHLRSAPDAAPALGSAITCGPFAEGGPWLQHDPVAVASGPIHRDRGVAFVLRDGQRIENPADIRAPFPPILGEQGHLARFRAKHPDLRALAVTGCGNLGLNAGVLARSRGAEHQVGAPGAAGPWLTIEPSGKGALREPTPADRFAITGPSLVIDGRATRPDPETVADLRHLLRFAFCDLGTGAMDFGLATLMRDSAMVRAAIAGEAVSLSMEAEREAASAQGGAAALAPLHETLRKAFRAKAYTEDDHLRESGSFRIAGDRVEVRFLAGIYPHHALCLDDQARPFSVLVPGKSNRAGTTLEDLGVDLAAAGVRAAILLDNGGDVGLWSVAEDRFVVRPAEADRAAAWPLSACLVWADQRTE